MPREMSFELTEKITFNLMSMSFDRLVQRIEELNEDLFKRFSGMYAHIKVLKDSQLQDTIVYVSLEYEKDVIFVEVKLRCPSCLVEVYKKDEFIGSFTTEGSITGVIKSIKFTVTGVILRIEVNDMME